MKSPQLIGEMMDRTTWYNAAEAKGSGLCDKIESSEIEKLFSGSPKMMWKQANVILNNAFKIGSEMIKVLEVGLSDAATEDNHC